MSCYVSGLTGSSAHLNNLVITNLVLPKYET